MAVNFPPKKEKVEAPKAIADNADKNEQAAKVEPVVEKKPVTKVGPAEAKEQKARKEDQA